MASTALPPFLPPFSYRYRLGIYRLFFYRLGIYRLGIYRLFSYRLCIYRRFFLPPLHLPASLPGCLTYRCNTPRPPLVSSSTAPSASGMDDSPRIGYSTPEF